MLFLYEYNDEMCSFNYYYYYYYYYISISII
jgi:hypothetical protein